jgi:hypothetical protein
MVFVEAALGVTRFLVLIFSAFCRGPKSRGKRIGSETLRPADKGKSKRSAESY